jgi:hypothetical protein
MKALRDPELKVLQMEGEDYDDSLFHTYLYLRHYISYNIHGLEFTSDECKGCFPQQSNQTNKHIATYDVYQKETLACRWKKF